MATPKVQHRKKPGPPKGQRHGGRKAGTPNRVTTEQVKQAVREVEHARLSGKKLAKEVLDDFMQLFAGMAAVYQPLPPGAPPVQGRLPNEEKFQLYAKLAIETARDLARYQSATFKAIMLSGEGASGATAPKQLAGPSSRMSPMEAFRLMRDGDVIDAEFEEIPPAISQKPRRA